MKHLETSFHLLPGKPPSATIHDFLILVFKEFKWFSPRRYGHASLSKHVTPGPSGLDALTRHYEDHPCLYVAAATDQDFIMIYPADPKVFPYTGAISWLTSARAMKSPHLQAAHTEQVVKVMRLFNSPLAQAGLDWHFHEKRNRLVDHGEYQEEAFTVRDYSEGLAGLFWRNFYGPPFVRLFGERLNALPPECVTRLGEELVLVQPYELPTEAGSQAARAREQQLISLLGPECFYDHVHHRLPTRRPVLPPPPWPTPGT